MEPNHASPGPETTAVATASAADDGKLRRALGTPSLALLTFSSVIGSGWLLSPYTVAKAAGPAALLTWVIGGFATLLVCLVFIDLAFRHPMSGGNVRWPRMAAGPLVGTAVSWAILLQAVFAGPSESTAVMQYLSRWLPSMVSGDSLSWLGRACAAAMLLVFAVISMFGVALVSTVNNVVTTIKLVVPAGTVILLLASGFDTENYAVGGGFAPYGVSAALSAVVGGGVVYAFTGINGAAVMSGEARNPRRSVPRATLGVWAGSFLLYLALQATMIFAPPSGLLGSGWHGLNLSSPLAQLAGLLGMGWLSTLLIADAVFSPSGSLFMGTSIKGRYTYGVAQNGLLPKAFTRVTARWGAPWTALLLNAVVGAVVVLGFGDWESIASSLSFFYGLSYAVVSVATTVLHRSEGAGTGYLGRWSLPVGSVSFVLSGLILYWSGWTKVRVAVPLLLIGFVLYLLRRRLRAEGVPVLLGGWLLAWLLLLGALSLFGSFKGLDVLPAPWDSVLAAAVSTAAWWAAHRSGLRYRARVTRGDHAPAPALATGN
ncbi:APC family permease [Amycolatopsis jiangsuensis]|uniref:Amino acid transporter n=1 Tax=Amycolatopsis jiangsuensis TaxID=1181879 RepID=A0A840IRP4_9PSEU|nr:APC family permease [Amycolatopsis jiangsuensis]MBB4683838.1 amino acid transporter [Amycolatopsis jiangsuensis]